MTIENLSKRFHARGRTVDALAQVSLAVDPREMLVLLGSSGCGKSTLLRSIAGLESPTDGRIVVGDDVFFDADRKINRRPNKRKIGLVFQNFALWPHMTVGRIVSYPLRVRRVKDRRERVLEALARMQCEELIDRYPAQLSGGQQQRVALARALVAEPSIVLFDEPLSSLDASLRIDLRRELRTLHRELGFTGIYVTHDLSEALELGDRVAVMRDGSIEQLSSPQELFQHPANPFVARFLGIRNQLPLEIQADSVTIGGRRAIGDLDALRRLAPSDHCVCYIRSTAIHMVRTPAPALLPGEIAFGPGTLLDEVFRGNSIEYRVRAGDIELSVVSNGRARSSADDVTDGEVYLVTNFDGMSVFAV